MCLNTGWPKSHSQTSSAKNSGIAHLFAIRFFALNQAQFNLEFHCLFFYFDQSDAFSTATSQKFIILGFCAIDLLSKNPMITGRNEKLSENIKVEKEILC